MPSARLDALVESRHQQGGDYHLDFAVNAQFDVSHFKEYDLCYNLVKECAPHTAIPYAPTNVDSFRECYMRTLTAASTKVGHAML